MILKRKYPNNNTIPVFSKKHSLELNVLLMQPFLPQELTDKERAILLHYLMLENKEDLFTAENKEIVRSAAKISNLNVLNEYNKRLRNKQAFIPVKRKWIINPILDVPKETTKYELNIVWAIEKK